ncbi:MULTISPECIES: DUF3886 domain-containing protein [Planococcus]|uniref:DUF3886 domain-containing protein n=2 Tax=Planococcus TaxID=1372 RepID=A0ABM5WVH2_9BACL|nr:MULTISPECIES: DUF3886 domain-containing protein [Planococcus]ALS78339.1 hypothetical protein AUO94_06555 [Planococcus kocurii]AQU79681.1 hypothetical protein AJGP001_10590 [Planococcus faecalis]KAA0958252.1 DUF3886 domain-containing protein [Planococcus sp. ANT_H30]MDJ0331711.1 DUF3886 domain-containing protein [Planococcus sp. S3-L1]OHX51599.1 hypothetical protein BB777_16505 [Planococcus faecalis]
MAKRKEESNSMFSEDMLSRLKETKKELLKEEQALEEEKEARRLFERKEREKNLSFAELLERHGDKGNKF